LPIIDPISGVQVNKLFMWNGKIWWAASQDTPLTFIQHQEINSILTAWGTNGSSIYQLFATPSTAIPKIVQSKLWAGHGMYTTKAVSRLWAMAQYYAVNNPNIVFSVDNEIGVDTGQTYTLSPRTVVWTTPPLVMTWTTQGGSPMVWFIAGISVYDTAPVGQQGVVVGVTGQTFCDDMALIAVAIDAIDVVYRG
jgi:hypothetical protein